MKLLIFPFDILFSVVKGKREMNRCNTCFYLYIPDHICELHERGELDHEEYNRIVHGGENNCSGYVSLSEVQARNEAYKKSWVYNR